MGRDNCYVLGDHCYMIEDGDYEVGDDCYGVRDYCYMVGMIFTWKWKIHFLSLAF